MATRPTVLFYVQHLLGTGHLRRVALIANALSAYPITVRVLSGGRPVQSLDFGNAELIQLPPVSARGMDFRNLIDVDGQPVVASLWAQRGQRLEQVTRQTPIDVVVTETFPFGRRALRREILEWLSLLAEIRPSVKLICSIRDIIQDKSPERSAESLQWLHRYYSEVLVHGSEAMTPLKLSFAAADRIRVPLIYTGYVSPLSTRMTEIPSRGNQILVAGGGGASGVRLYQAALAAAQDLRLSGYRWRLLVGHGESSQLLQDLTDRAPENVLVERARADFRTLIHAAALVVCQAGYNTVVELLQTDTPLVLVPFDAAGELEQVIRARQIVARDRAIVVADARVDGPGLADAAVKSLTRGPVRLDLADNGTDRTAAHLAAMVNCYSVL